MLQRGNPVELLDVGDEYKIFNGRVFCIVEYKKKKYRAVGSYEDFQKRNLTEQKALLMPEIEGYMSIPFIKIKEEENAETIQK